MKVTAAKKAKRPSSPQTGHKEAEVPLELAIMTTNEAAQFPERSYNMKRCPHCGEFLKPKNALSRHLKQLFDATCASCTKPVIIEFGPQLKSWIIH